MTHMKKYAQQRFSWLATQENRIKMGALNLLKDSLISFVFKKNLSRKNQIQQMKTNFFFEVIRFVDNCYTLIIWQSISLMENKILNSLLWFFEYTFLKKYTINFYFDFTKFELDIWFTLCNMILETWTLTKACLFLGTRYDIIWNLMPNNHMRSKKLVLSFLRQNNNMKKSK